jgi:hypothetical protein
MHPSIKSVKFTPDAKPGELNPTTQPAAKSGETRFTPSPWMICRTRTDGGAPIIVGRRRRDQSEREVAKALFHNGSDDPEVHANAHLIAAAPDLYAALAALVPADFDEHPGDFSKEWHVARAALALARGEAVS